jgi:undecaprenol kinase
MSSSLKTESLQQQDERLKRRVFLRRYLKQFQMFRLPNVSASTVDVQLKAQAYGDKAKGFGAHSFFASVGYAIEGLQFAFQQERNFRIDCYLVAGAMILAVMFQIPLQEWAILLEMGGFVLFAELANTVVEWLTDLLTQGRYDIRAKRIKDIAAGACLVVAAASYGVVAMLFWPYFTEMFSTWGHAASMWSFL